MTLHFQPNHNLSYGTFSSRVRDRAIGNRTPVIGTLELTGRCNLRCAHCYISTSDSTNDAVRAPQWKQILEELAASGCLWLAITGGEPLLHPDFAEIYRMTRGLGFLVTLMTNGTLIDKKTVDLLREFPPLLVEVSLYGAGPKTYGEVTGDEDAYAACLRGVETLTRAGIRTTLKTTVTRANKKDLGPMREIATRFGVSFRTDGLLNSRLSGDGSPMALRIPAEEWVALEMSSPAVKDAWKTRRAHQKAALEAGGDLLFACGAGKNTFHVNFKGEVSPCIMAREPRHDLTCGGFSKWWNSDALCAMVCAPAAPGHVCGRCPDADVCDTCAGWGCMEHGDPGAKVEYLCTVAAARSRALAEMDE